MDFKEFELLDTTYELHVQIPTWNGSCGFSEEIKTDMGSPFPVHYAFL